MRYGPFEVDETTVLRIPQRIEAQRTELGNAKEPVSERHDVTGRTGRAGSDGRVRLHGRQELNTLCCTVVRNVTSTSTNPATAVHIVPSPSKMGLQS